MPRRRPARSSNTLFWIYMLRLANGAYYTGYTTDLQRRVQAHRSGRGSKITRSFTPTSVAACWKLHSQKGTAMRVEAWIKGCTREVKQALIDHPENLETFLRRRGLEEKIEPVAPLPGIKQPADSGPPPGIAVPPDPAAG